MNIIRRMVKSSWFWLVVVSTIPLVPLFHEGIPLTHDGRIHIARIANFYASFMEGNIVPRWASNLNWGYGSPIIEFVYPLPSYVASLFHIVGFSLVDSTKLVFAVAYILSALTIFFWIREQLGIVSGVVASILYTFAPYRFVDLYVRGALGEHVAFIYPPLLCWSLLRLARYPKQYISSAIIFGLSTAGLILSHNALSVIFLPIVGIYGLYLCVYETKQKHFFVFFGLMGLMFGFLLSAFFWVPAVFEQKYILIDKVTQGALGGFTAWNWFISSSWNFGGGTEFSKEIGMSGWIAIIGSFWCMWKARHWRDRWLIGGCLVLFFSALFLMTPQSAGIWTNIPLMIKLQFPWRFLSLTTFLAAVLGGLTISHILKIYRQGQHVTRFFCTVFCLLSIIISSNMWYPNGYINYPHEYFTGIFDGTTDTGEASPIWSVRFMEQRPKAPIEVISGDARIETRLRNTTTREYAITNEHEVQLVENTLYFPGWNVFVDNNIIPIEFQSSLHRGLMTFFVPKGTHTVKIRFSDTKVRRTANWISALSIVVLTSIGIGGFLWQKRRSHHQ
ncbi:MAG: 6-pyruvoyl-tetrahydropterin synthase-related protein [Candidatus Gottesmanbacteria bacterium]|nr:6-pyruvoyl-tetrahydropterin synthase-related protein [Candidatus Gottesmanbacteria bacterium]